MPTVSTVSSALKSPLICDRRVKSGIRLQFKRLDQSPQTADNIRNIAALPANYPGLMLVEPVHSRPPTSTHVLDRHKFH